MKRAAPLLVMSMWTLALPGALGCQAREAPPPGLECQPAAPRPEGVLVAGTGAGIAPMRLLARKWRREGGERALVLASVGTEGGVAALRAGDIDVAISARPLSRAERAQGLDQVRLATSLLVFARRGPPLPMSTQQIARIYRGTQRQWPDGDRVVPLFREEEDSGLELLREHLPELGEALRPPARDAARGLILYTDQHTRDALLEVDGALGWTHLGMIRIERLALSPIALDGVRPTLAHAREGRYPLLQPLYLLWRPGADEATDALVESAHSAGSRRLLEEYGYLTD